MKEYATCDVISLLAALGISDATWSLTPQSLTIRTPTGCVCIGVEFMVPRLNLSIEQTKGE